MVSRHPLATPGIFFNLPPPIVHDNEFFFLFTPSYRAVSAVSESGLYYLYSKCGLYFLSDWEIVTGVERYILTQGKYK